MKRVAPPTGAEPPHVAFRRDGTELPLDEWARELCDQYFAAYPDHIEHYGPAGDAWCVHDSLYIFAWAFGDLDWGGSDLKAQVKWLATVLTARGFPLDRFVRHLELAGVVAANRGCAAVARMLDDAAAYVSAEFP